MNCLLLIIAGAFLFTEGGKERQQEEKFRKALLAKERKRFYMSELCLYGETKNAII